MADAEFALGSSTIDDCVCEEVGFSKENLKKSTTTSSNNSYCSADSAPTTEEEEEEEENYTEDNNKCDSQKKEDVHISEDLFLCSATFHKGSASEKATKPTRLSPEVKKDVITVSTCDEHLLPITLYCDTCCVSFCVSCWETHHHQRKDQEKKMSCSSPISLNLIALEKRTQGSVLLENLASFKEQARKQSTFLGEILPELTERSERKCEGLWNEMEVLFTSLRRRMALLISQIQTETLSQKSKLERKYVTWNSYIHKIESVQSRLTELLHDANNVNFVSEFKDIKSKTDSLDIDKFVNMMETRSMLVDVEYSQEYLNLHRNVSKLIIGKPRLTMGSASPVDIQQSLSRQSSHGYRTDKGTTQYDVSGSVPQNSPSNLALTGEGCQRVLNLSDMSKLNYDGKSSGPTQLPSKTDVDDKNSSTQNNSSSFRSSLTTFSEISSLECDSDNVDTQTFPNNVASPSTTAVSIGSSSVERDTKNLSGIEVGSLEAEYFPRQMPILKASYQWPLILEKDTYVRGLTITEDDHIFVCDRSSKKITQFNPDGKLICRCDVSGIPWDVCAFSNSILFVTLPQKSKLLLLQRCTGKCLLAVSLAVPTGAKKYVSLTKVSIGILACDQYANIDVLDSNGNVLSTIVSSTKQTECNVSHRLCSGQIGDSFWLLNVSSKIMSYHRLDGEVLLSHQIAFKENTSDICTDCYNCVYGCDKKRIYSLTSEGGDNILWSFKQELKNHPRMCVNSARDKLFLTYQLDQKNILKIFTISPKFLLANTK